MSSEPSCPTFGLPDCLVPPGSFSAGTHVYNSGDEAWMLISSALVQLMTPGVALFYGGLVGQAEVITSMMLCFGSMSVVTILWSLITFSMSFGPHEKSQVFGNGFYGTLDNISAFSSPYSGAPGITIHTFAQYQLMFAIVTVALISGSVVGKIKWTWFLAFAAIWHVTVYAPLAHWIFYNGGWLYQYGVLDFAGGMVIHTSSGVSSFVLAYWLGGKAKQQTYPQPHNVPFVLLGTALLWFGWFGFNAGSAVGANFYAGLAFTTTQHAAAVSMLMWNCMECIFDGPAGWFKGRPTAVGASMGIVVGLVTVTPAAGFVTPMFGMLMGVLGAISVFFFPRLIKRLTGVDDRLDCLAIHGVGGMVGAAFTGLFANSEQTNGSGLLPGAAGPGDENPSAYGTPIPAIGSFFGNGVSLGKQCAGISVTILYSVVGTTIIYWLLWAVAKFVFNDTLTIPEELRANADVSLHGEAAYYTTVAKHSAAPTAAGVGSNTATAPVPAVGAPAAAATAAPVAV